MREIPALAGSNCCKKLCHHRRRRVVRYLAVRLPGELLVPQIHLASDKRLLATENQGANAVVKANFGADGLQNLGDAALKRFAKLQLRAMPSATNQSNGL